MSAQLNITSLVNAVERLDEGLHRYLLDKDGIQIRDGLVQRFEFTCELTILQTYLPGCRLALMDLHYCNAAHCPLPNTCEFNSITNH